MSEGRMGCRNPTSFAHGRGLVLFRPGANAREKVRGLLFGGLFGLIALGQAGYWLFANQVEPIWLGMPWAMLVIVALATAQFWLLLLLYFLERPRGGS